MATLCTVAGTDRTSRIKRGTVRISKVSSGRDTFSCVFLSKTSGTLYRPVQGEELLYSIDGGLPAGFGGTIVSVEESAVKDPDIAWACKVDAVGFSEWLDLVMVDDVWIANGLWDRLYYYHQNFLLPRFGTTWGGGGISGGPPLPASTYALRTLADVVEEMCNIAGGYIFNIGGNKVFGVGLPGAVAGPVALSQSNSGLANGSAQSVKRRKKRITWFTRGYMKVSAPEGTAQDAAYTVTNEVHTSDGVVGEFPLRRRPVEVVPTQVSINGAAAIALPSGGYSYDASKKAIMKSAPFPVAGTTITIPSYGSKFPTTVVYDDQKTQIRETIVEDAAPETTLAQADGILAYTVQFSTSTPSQEADVETREPGFYVGMSVSLSFATRTVAGTYWVVSIDISDDARVRPSVAKRHRYVLHCVEGSAYVSPWQSDLRKKFGGGGGGRSSISSGTVTPPTSGTGEYPVGATIQCGGDNYNAVPATTTFVDIPQMQGNKFGAVAGVWKFQAFGFQISAGTMQIRLFAGGVQIALASSTAVGALLSGPVTFTPVAVTVPAGVVDLLCQYNVTAGARDVVIGKCFLYRES